MNFPFAPDCASIKNPFLSDIFFFIIAFESSVALFASDVISDSKLLNITAGDNSRL